MPIHYRDIIVKSFRITWHYKFLWFYGLFAALVTGSAIQFFTNQQDWLIDWQNLEFAGLQNMGGISAIMQAAAADPAGFAVRLAVLVVLLVLALFVLWLGIVSQGGLLWGAARLNDKKKLNFGEVMKTGRERFWIVLLLHIVQRLLLGGIVAFMGMAIAMSVVRQQMVIDLAATAALLVGLAVMFIVAMTIRYALLYVAIDNDTFGGALHHALQLWREKPLVTIEMGVLVFAIQIVLGFVFTLLFFALLIPWYFALVSVGQLQAVGGVIMLLILGMMMFAGLAALGGAVITTFRETLWAVFFTDYRKNGGQSVFAGLVGLRPKKRSGKKRS